MKNLLAAILASLIIGGCLGVGSALAPGTAAIASDASEAVPPPKPLPISASSAPEQSGPARATVLAAGDNLIHDIIYQTAGRYAEAPGEYDFRPFYSHVRGRIAAADAATINQETPLAGSRPPSNYPLFNSPPALAGQLAEIGFDAVSIANNHMLDQGAAGLQETLDALHAVRGLAVCGAFRTAEERNDIPILERNGIAFACLGFTQFTNGLVLPKDQAFRIIYAGDRDAVRKQIAAARKKADVVVVNVHWGDEYSATPNALQKELAQFFADCGADVVFGHHPHVLQPAAKIKSADGREVPVFYSLGNFFSAQHKAVTMVGALAEAVFEKDPATGKTAFKSAVIVPVVTHFNSGFGDLAVYPLESYTDQLAAVHAVRQRFGEAFSVEWIKKHVAASCGEAYEIEGV